jgi:TolB-like protein/Tfp pilus assembly protein PilF
MRRLLSELRRRNVIRVGLLYLAFAWLVLQAGDVVFDLLGVPEWALRLTAGLLLLGFPGVLIFSWVYELTPDGLKRETQIDHSTPVDARAGRRLNVMIGMLAALAIGVVAADRLIPRGDARQPSTAVTTASQAGSVAVLAFANMSSDPELEYLSDGLSDTLIHFLAQSPELRVVARTSSFQFKGRNLDIREVGRQLGVGTVLEGSVQRSGDRLRVIAQLINVADGTHYWSRTFDRQMADVFAIQDEIGREVLGALQVSLRQAAAALPREAAGSRNLAAYEAYLLGRARMARRTRVSVGEALGHFERALAVDPGYALAHVGRAHAMVTLASSGALDSAAARQQAAASLDRALALDPLLGDAYAVRGLQYMNDSDNARAVADFRRAIELAPSHAEAHTWYMGVLMQEGQFEEAERFGRRSVELDPLAPITHVRMGYLAYARQRPREALPFFLRAIEVDPLFAIGYGEIANYIGDYEGQIEESIRWNRRAVALDPAGGLRKLNETFRYLDLNDEPRAREALDAARREAPGHHQVAAVEAVFALLSGDEREAERLADRALAEGGPAGPALWAAVEVAQRTAGARGVLDALEKYHPELLLKTPDSIASAALAGYPADLLAVTQLAAALIQTGEAERGRALAERVLAAVSAAPVPAWGSWSPWVEVQALEILGRTEEADAVLRRHVAAGARANWRFLGESSALDSLRGRSAFHQVLAEIEAWAARARENLARTPELSDDDVKRAIAARRI